MKKFFSGSLMAVSILLGASNPGFSQQLADNNTEMHAALVSMQQVSRDYNSTADAKAVRNFKKKFSAVNDEKWYKYKGGYTAAFLTDDVRFRVEFDTKGNLTGIEKDYTEAKFDREVRRVVKSVYYDYGITWIREISLPGVFEGPVYIVFVEDGVSFKELSVYDGEMHVLEEFPKN
jgi:hypothetical protein